MKNLLIHSKMFSAVTHVRYDDFPIEIPEYGVIHNDLQLHSFVEAMTEHQGYQVTQWEDYTGTPRTLDSRFHDFSQTLSQRYNNLVVPTGYVFTADGNHLTIYVVDIGHQWPREYVVKMDLKHKEPLEIGGWQTSDRNGHRIISTILMFWIGVDFHTFRIEQRRNVSPHTITKKEG